MLYDAMLMFSLMLPRHAMLMPMLLPCRYDATRCSLMLMLPRRCLPC